VANERSSRRGRSRNVENAPMGSSITATVTSLAHRTGSVKQLKFIGTTRVIRESKDEIDIMEML
jgi:hypothetical protein